MAGVINIALIPFHSLATSAVLNTPTQALETEVNKHLAGTAYRHLTTEIDSELTTEVSAPVTPTAAQTTLKNRQSQILTVLDKMLDGGAGGTDWVAKYGALSSNANLTNLYTIINSRTALATPSTPMARDGSGSTAVVSLTATTVNASGTITAAGFSGPLSGNATTATNVAASGITGTIAASQIDSAIARVANVPSNTGAGASGTWGISISGSAPASGITGTVAASQIDSAIARVANVPTNAGVGATGTWGISVSGSAANVPMSGITTPGAAGNLLYSSGTAVLSGVPSVAIGDYTITPTKLSEGALTPGGGLLLNASGIHKWTADGTSLLFGGATIDLTSYVPVSSSYNVSVLIYVNATPALRAIAGTPVARALIDADRPQAQANTTPLGYVALSYGQTVITAANISPWIGVGGFPSSAVSGGSTPGHRHDILPEVRQPLGAIDEAYPAPTATASNQILISPFRYRASDGTVASVGTATTFGTFGAPGSGYRCYGVYFDPTARVIAQTAPVDSAVYPFIVSKPTFSGNQRSICYVFLTSRTPVTINAGPDGTNGWIEDARVILAGSAPATSPVGVVDGGTGGSGFSQGIVWQADGSTPTTPLVTMPATKSTTVGFAIQPAPSGMGAGATVYDIELGGGAIANGATTLTRIVGLHAVAPVKGAGATTDSVALQAELPANGANNASGVFAGAVRVGSTVMPTKTLDVTGTFGVSGASTLAGTLAVSTALAGALTQEAWTAPTLLNSWVNFGAGTLAAGYYKDSEGEIKIRGHISSGTPINGSAAMFVLPVGYRPSGTTTFPVISNSALGFAHVDSAGSVIPDAGSNVYFSINPIRFDTR